MQKPMMVLSILPELPTIESLFFRPIRPSHSFARAHSGSVLYWAVMCPNAARRLLGELCASPKAHGLLHNLTVLAAAKKDKYDVVPGARQSTEARVNNPFGMTVW
jgi:hypothetical protein